MDVNAWLIFVVAETLLCLAPGVAVLMVVSVGLTRGAKASAVASLGILGANAVYFALSAIGVGSLILMSHDLFNLVRWVGVIYLVWIGLQTFMGSHASLSAAAGSAETRYPAIFRAGLIMKLADPKTLFYFVALLPQFIDRRRRRGASGDDPRDHQRGDRARRAAGLWSCRRAAQPLRPQPALRQMDRPGGGILPDRRGVRHGGDPPERLGGDRCALPSLLSR